ncbi:conjugal transfer protein TraG N-terminal domain-containing protein [Burkholderia stagnalis]|uniref:conjugal transfer protein TraG N-terminal domain-containing protein n=1 Tax=Burkholderia stagnalis TaxID=1503054 RepID=UPI00075F4E2C|nr:conjugal transfer protein TraG N-terminal domain-containing protein [Burkholderia stagnalis]KVL85354.1 conjugal transfer protein TraG [Burkholderia stagnalis]KVL92001.1 conjugal transfer protein TraG [Burkholderia stagnalis]KVM06140.1 conjugal transfer protein TraG [Burkholderia stagnalis]
MGIEIQTWWNVDTLYYVLNAVAATMMSVGYSGLLKFVFIIALMIGLFGYVGRQFELMMWFIQALMFVTILNLPIARVALVDRTGLEPPRTIDHVPVALASVAQASSLVFNYLTRTYETVFGVPDDLGLEKGDVGFGHRILRQVNSAVVRDPGLRADLMQFFKECTKYDILDGVITPDQIVAGTDTWNTIFSNTSPARFATYNVLTNTPKTDTCVAVAQVLKTRVEGAVTSAQQFYGRQAFPQASSDGLAQQMFLSTVSTSYSWLLDASASASDAMKQAMFNNVWRDAGTAMARAHNDPAAIADTNALIAEAEAARQANGSNSTLSLLGQETIPHMRNWIEAILYALFPVVVALMVLVPAEAAKRVLAGYFMGLVWIGLWPVLFAIINHLSLIHLHSKLAALKLAAGVPFQLSNVFDATIVDEQAMIGYMVVLVPFIAGAVVRMADGQIYGMADRMISGFSSAGARSGAAIAGGNYSMGQSGIDTSSVNTTTMQKFDSGFASSSGSIAMQLADGSTLRVSSNGRAALDRFQEHMLHSMVSADERSIGSSSERFSGTSNFSGSSNISRTGTSLSGTETFGHSADRGTSQGTSQLNSVTDSGGLSGRSAHDESVGRDRSIQSGFGQSVQGQDSITLTAGANATIGNPNGAPPPQAPTPGGPSQASAARDQARVRRAMEQGGASPEQIASATSRMPQPPSASVGAPGRSASPLGAQLGGSISGVRNYSAQQTRTHSFDESHRNSDTASRATEYSHSGSATAQNTTGEQSAQSDRHDRTASRTTTSESASQSESGFRRESGSRTSSASNSSRRHEVMENMMADPELFWKVAQANHMSATRFVLQNEDKIVGMVGQYLDNQAMAQHVSTPTWGSPYTPDTPGYHDTGRAASRASDGASRRPGGERARTFDSLVRDTGFGSVAPVQPNMAPPSEIAGARADASAPLAPSSPQSLGTRAQDFDKEVQRYASPDRALGEGRVTQTEVNAANEGRDLHDTARRTANTVKEAVGLKPGEDYDKKDVPPRIN